MITTAALLASTFLTVAAPAATPGRVQQEGATGSPAEPNPSLQNSSLQEAFAEADATLSAIEALPASKRTVDNTLVAIDDVVARLFIETRMAGFMSNVSTDAGEREDARAAQTDLSNWFDRLAQNEGLFLALEELGRLNAPMTPEERRYFDESLRDYRRAGMGLPGETRSRIAAIDVELNDLGSDFRRNIADDDTVCLLTREELVGVPDSFVGSLQRSGELFIVKINGPTFGFVLGYCENASTRMKIGVAAGLRGGLKNVRILEKIIALRHERATLLGYPTTAAYEIETKMAKDPDTVWAFYDDLRPKLRKKSLTDFEEFQNAKREHTGDPEALLGASDVSFYTNWLKREKYAVDTLALRDYFPMDAVTNGMFGVYQDLFGIQFTDITEQARAEGRPLWHEDASLHQVTDTKSGEVLGEFYLDLFPREGKFNHAAQFPLRLRKVWSDGNVTKPLVALVCNFTKPTETQPSLLSHSEVETFFHEFGHCLHSILTETTLASFSGTNVARDFVEAPSQMLENWTWQPEVLARFARHYETGEPLPKAMIDGMIAAKNLGSGMSNEGQVFLGMMDMRFHTDEDGIVDTTAVSEATYRETRVFRVTQNLIRQASFGHLVGYEAGYYGYLWSSVYAQDMWSRFAAEPMNSEVAMDYRKKVLAKGGSRDALDMVEDFLGREPNAAAFLKHLGL